MVALALVATLVVAALASLFMAWAIGAGSSGSTPFAPAVGANAISVMRAGFYVGLLGLLGALLQGANVTEAVGRELIGGVTLSPLAAVVALLLAAALVAIGVFAGYPIATAFTVTGAVVGVGLAMGGDPAWAKYREISTLWVLVPFVGGGTAYATARLLRSDRVPERAVLLALAALVGVILANVDFALLGPAGQPSSVVDALYIRSDGPSRTPFLVGVSAVFGLVAAGLLAWDLREGPVAAQRHFLLVLGGLVAFSAGGSQVGLALGPLLPLLDDLATQIPLWVVLFGGGVGLLAGSWTGAPRMIKTLAQDYSSLGPRRSIAALIPSFAIAQSAVFLGVPVSFNEIIVSAIIGSGYAAGGSGVSAEKMLKTVGAWVLSLALALGLGYGIYTAVSLALGIV
ncbi:inorganic phosphate transporter [Halomarina oriensis]|uniref:Phosphate transporter n=1 Tax=Halomarina oriensis TaxID=671145 RepID=A0A6B0GIJ8_9EURY|nr:inorganic phosphate transporter [Halomarina oriensis]MWG34460.1 inorganic phosphate transporter [Halomarina oriensis]